MAVTASDISDGVPRLLSDRAYDELLEAIVSGRLAPDTPLRLDEVAARLGTSRTPVREALRRLVDEGLVEVRPRSGTRVAALETARDAVPVLASLQALGARLGVPHLTPDDDTAMTVADADRAAALERGDVRDAIAADDRLHAVLLKAAGNGELERAIARVLPAVRRLDLLHFAALAEGRAPDAHRGLLAACRRRDAARAADLVEASFLALGAQS